MFLHHDLGWWGFWITLGLAYPLSVLANLTTPILKDWWAARSRAGLQNRVRTLTTKLACMEQHPPLTNAEYLTLMGIRGIGKLIVASTHIIVGTGFLTFTLVYTQKVEHLPRGWFLFFIYLLLLNVFNYWVYIYAIQNVAWNGTLDQRDKIKNKIDKLTEKIAKQST
jgi:hypothetical protein